MEPYERLVKILDPIIRSDLLSNLLFGVVLVLVALGLLAIVKRVTGIGRPAPPPEAAQEGGGEAEAEAVAEEEGGPPDEAGDSDTDAGEDTEPKPPGEGDE